MFLLPFPLELDLGLVALRQTCRNGLLDRHGLGWIVFQMCGAVLLQDQIVLILQAPDVFIHAVDFSTNVGMMSAAHVFQVVGRHALEVVLLCPLDPELAAATDEQGGKKSGQSHASHTEDCISKDGVVAREGVLLVRRKGRCVHEALAVRRADSCNLHTFGVAGVEA